MKKWVSIKKTYYREGRHVQKKARMTGKKQRKIHRFFSQKSMKNRWKSGLQRPSQQKSKKWLPWDPHFPLKYHFWLILGYRGGAKNPPQGVVNIGQNPCLQFHGSIIGPVSHFSQFWFPFWVPLGLILDPSELHFEKKCGWFRIFALVSHIVWMVGWLVGLIGLLGLLGWLGWIVGWALGWLGWSIGLVKWKDSKDREDDPTTHNPMDVARRNARSD